MSLKISYINGRTLLAVEVESTFGATDIRLVAEYGGDDVGWLFAGQADAGDSGMPLGSWLAGYSAQLPVPASLTTNLSTLVIHEYALSFNAGGAAGGMENFQLSFTASLADLDFKFSFRNQESGSQFTAVYLGNTLDPTPLEALFNLIFPPDIARLLPVANITLQSLFFAGQQHDSGTAFLVGFDPGHEIDFSGLDLVGEHLGEITLNYQLLLASAPITAAVAASIAESLDQLSSPFPGLETSSESGGGTENAAVLQQGVNLRCKLEIGANPFSMLAPVPAAAETAATSTSDSNSDPAAEPAPDSIHWLPIGRALGPVFLARIGFSMIKTPELQLKISLDAILDIGTLFFALQGLSLTNPLDRLAPVPGLDGFALGSRARGLEISGMFTRQGAPANPEFVGSAEIKAQSFAISVMGAFQQIGPGEFALFMYVKLDQELGGPAFFYVTGLSFGFGYNRRVLLPENPRQIADFSLVAPLMGDAADGSDPLKQARDMSVHFPAQLGSFWLAAGVRFESFRMIESTAVLLVRFENTIDISLLGISTLTLPRPPKGQKTVANPYALVQLAFQVNVKPQEGVVKAEGVLTDKSYLISPDARLGGGFAFYTWFGRHRYAGDFVLSIGGYHPRYDKPGHYPVVPRLSLNWPISPELTVKGEAYLALTPAHIMAGGRLEASYNAGRLSASFTAYADFLMQWEPFSYDAEIGIRVAVTYDALLGPISTELSADLHLWGPAMAGLARISWTVFSFEVPIGRGTFAEWKAANNAKTIAAPLFEEKFLPERGQRSQLRITAGLEREINKGNQAVWVIQPEYFRLETESALPLTHIFLDLPGEVPQPLLFTPKEDVIGLQPVGSDTYHSYQTITIQPKDPSTPIAASWQAASRSTQVPAALWDPAGRPAASGDIPRVKTMSRSNGLHSLQLDSQTKLMNPTAPFNILVFEFDPLPAKGLPLNAIDGDADGSDNAAASSAAAITLPEIIDVLAAAGLGPFSSSSTAPGTIDVDRSPLHPPMLGHLGQEVTETETPIEITILPPRTVESTAEELDLLIRFLAALWLFAAHQSGPDQADPETDIRSAMSAPPTGTAEITIQAPEPAGISASGAEENLLSATPFGLDDEESPVPAEMKPFTQQLVAGKTLLWAIEPGRDAPATALQLKMTPSSGLESASEVRIIELDRYSRLLSNAVTSPRDITLNEETAFLAVMGLGAAADEAALAGKRLTVGWRGHSTLLQIRPRQLIHGDVLIQPQAPRLIPYNGRQYTFGAVRGNSMARENLIRSEDGTQINGWIKTRLPGQVEGTNIQTIAVCLKRRPEADATQPDSGRDLRVSLSNNNSHREQPGHTRIITLNPTELVYIFPVNNRLHANLNAAAPHALTVQTSLTSTGWNIDGVIGLPVSRRQLRTPAHWQNFTLDTRSIPRPADAGKPPVMVELRLPQEELNG